MADPPDSPPKFKTVQLRLYAEDVEAAKELAEMYPRGSYQAALRELLHEALSVKLREHRDARRKRGVVL